MMLHGVSGTACKGQVGMQRAEGHGSYCSLGTGDSPKEWVRLSQLERQQGLCEMGERIFQALVLGGW